MESATQGAQSSRDRKITRMGFYLAAPERLSQATSVSLELSAPLGRGGAFGSWSDAPLSRVPPVCEDHLRRPGGLAAAAQHRHLDLREHGRKPVGSQDRKRAEAGRREREDEGIGEVLPPGRPVVPVLRPGRNGEPGQIHGDGVHRGEPEEAATSNAAATPVLIMAPPREHEVRHAQPEHGQDGNRECGVLYCTILYYTILYYIILY